MMSRGIIILWEEQAAGPQKISKDTIFMQIFHSTQKENVENKKEKQKLLD